MTAGPRGLRLNNPGNIRAGIKWDGMAPDQPDPDFVAFIASEWGIRAMARILQNYAAQGICTVSAIINRWAPSSENDTAAYITDVCNRLGVHEQDWLVSPDSLPQLIEAIIWHEQGQMPYTPDLIQKGISMANPTH